MPDTFTIPAGWKLVPEEPTPAMTQATWDHSVDKEGGVESQNTRNRRVYTAMIAAAPKAPQAAVADGWKLVPAKATRDWAYDLATYRQGRSSTPRCEGPTQGDVDWGMDRIREVLAAAPSLNTGPEVGGGEEDLAGLLKLVDDVARRCRERAGYDDELSKETLREAASLLEKLAARLTPAASRPVEQGDPVAWLWEYVDKSGEWYEIASVERPSPEGRRNIRPLGLIESLASSPPTKEEEPVAWEYEELKTHLNDEWEFALSHGKPDRASYIRNIRPLYAHPAPAASRPAVGREEIAHRVIEAADCIGVPGADWALTIEWPDGSETLERVSNQAAQALGYRPDDEEASDPRDDTRAGGDVAQEGGR